MVWKVGKGGLGRVHLLGLECKTVYTEYFKREWGIAVLLCDIAGVWSMGEEHIKMS